MEIILLHITVVHISKPAILMRGQHLYFYFYRCCAVCRAVLREPVRVPRVGIIFIYRCVFRVLMSEDIFIFIFLPPS